MLFYVVTRDKLNNEWDKVGAALLVDMLESTPESNGKELTGKDARDYRKIEAKNR